MNERSPLASLYPSITVLDEIGVGLVLFDQEGEVAVTNSIAEELGRRRTHGGVLSDELVERARAMAPDSVPSGSVDHGIDGGQDLIDAWDPSGQKCIIGYRSVRSSRFGTIFILRDITDAERARADHQKLERLSQLGKACAMVAHEIGNPLAAIKATIQSIEREAAAAGLEDPISAVQREIDRLDRVLRQLLGFVRHRVPRKVRVDLRVVVERARLAAAARLNGVTFHTFFGDLRPVLADPDQIEQVLVNLFVNAAEAMPGGGRLWLRARLEGESVAIRVEDDGPGIPPELREKVFESFYTTRAAGTGLGLSVCYRIIRDHGGALSVEGRTGGGASMLVTLPAAPGA